LKRAPYKLGILAVTALIALGAGALYAQDAPDPAPDDPTVTTDGQEKVANLSPEDMVAEAENLIRGMQTLLKKVVGLQQVARKQKDVIKLNCVNDKLLQIKQLMNIAEGATTNMHEAIAQDDDPARYHEFGKIVIASQQVNALAGEAETCIGEELVFLGPTEVTADEPELPDDPDEDTPEDAIEDPGYASPYS
jgi:hypothetical protein